MDSWVALYVMGWSWHVGDHPEVPEHTGRQAHLLPRRRMIEDMEVVQDNGRRRPPRPHPHDRAYEPRLTEDREGVRMEPLPVGQHYRLIWPNLPAYSFDSAAACAVAREAGIAIFPDPATLGRGLPTWYGHPVHAFTFVDTALEHKTILSRPYQVFPETDIAMAICKSAVYHSLVKKWEAERIRWHFIQNHKSV